MGPGPGVKTPAVDWAYVPARAGPEIGKDPDTASATLPLGGPNACDDRGKAAPDRRYAAAHHAGCVRAEQGNYGTHRASRIRSSRAW